MNIYDMLSEHTVKEICEYFGGRQHDHKFPYKYKSHTPLVGVLESKFKAHNLDDIYPCSRWMLTQMALEQIWGMNKYNDFFTTILSTRFIKSEHPDWDAMQCSSASKQAYEDFNKILSYDDYELLRQGNTCKLVKVDSNLDKIGEGGFAIVYKVDGTSLVRKVLKEEHKGNGGTLSRFKGEYEISKSLEGMNGIIKVYDYDSINVSYTMEYHSQDLSNYIKSNELDLAHKKLLIFELLDIMKNVHNKDIIHRDLAPHNIFIENGRPIIADFGLGKDLNAERSHQTYDTASQGTLEYCDPRQYRQLSLGDKQSDIYSLGKLISFILTTNPSNTMHDYRVPVMIATNEDENVRYKTIEMLIEALLKTDKQRDNKAYADECTSKIDRGIYDSNMDNYLLEKKGTDLVYQCDNYKFFNAYTNLFDKPQLYPAIKKSLDETLEEMNNSRLQFKYLDGFGNLMVNVLANPNVTPDIKIIASSMVYTIAVDISRWSVQAHFRDLYNKGMIEDIYASNLIEALI